MRWVDFPLSLEIDRDTVQNQPTSFFQREYMVCKQAWTFKANITQGVLVENREDFQNIVTPNSRWSGNEIGRERRAQVGWRIVEIWTDILGEKKKKNEHNKQIERAYDANG